PLSSCSILLLRQHPEAAVPRRTTPRPERTAASHPQGPRRESPPPTCRFALGFRLRQLCTVLPCSILHSCGLSAADWWFTPFRRDRSFGCDTCAGGRQEYRRLPPPAAPLRDRAVLRGWPAPDAQLRESPARRPLLRPARAALPCFTGPR